MKKQLIQLAEACGLPQRIQSLYQGDKVNSSEDRAALHTALRLPKTAKLCPQGVDVVAEVAVSLDKAADLVSRIRNGISVSYTHLTLPTKLL